MALTFSDHFQLHHLFQAGFLGLGQTKCQPPLLQRTSSDPGFARSRSLPGHCLSFTGTLSGIPSPQTSHPTLTSGSTHQFNQFFSNAPV